MMDTIESIPYSMDWLVINHDTIRRIIFLVRKSESVVSSTDDFHKTGQT